MTETKRGLVAVIFISQRNGRNEHDYAAAAMAMAEEASLQPGYAGIDSVRDDQAMASPSHIGRTKRRRSRGAVMPTVARCATATGPNGMNIMRRS